MGLKALVITEQVGVRDSMVQWLNGKSITDVRSVPLKDCPGELVGHQPDIILLDVPTSGSHSVKGVVETVIASWPRARGRIIAIFDSATPGFLQQAISAGSSAAVELNRRKTFLYLDSAFEKLFTP